MSISTADRLSAYMGAYKALCMIGYGGYEHAAEAAQAEEKPARTEELDGDTEFEKIILSMPFDRAHAKAVDIAAHGEVWHHKHMLWCQAHGLQGHKRLNRYESGEDRRHYIKVQNYCLDMFGEVVEPAWDYTVSAPNDIKGYLEAYLDWEDSVYTRLAAISNDLITLGFPCETELVKEGLPRKEVEKVRRMLTEYGLSGWDMPYILIRDHELHERMKEKEKHLQ